MTDPSLSPVELIAEALRQHRNHGSVPSGFLCQCNWSGYSHETHAAAAIEAAVRSWPAVVQAQLVGRPVFVAANDPNHDAWKIATSTVTDPNPAAFIIDPSPPGFEAPAQLIGDTE